MKGFINATLPESSRRRAVAVRIKNRLRGRTKVVLKDEFSYQEWIKSVEPTLWEKLDLSAYHPLISVVVPVFNTPDKYIKPLLRSLEDQTYPNWQLCMVDASTDDARARALKEEAGRDERITYRRLKANLGIAGNTNQGLKLARGEFIGLLDHDDVLSPHALEEVARVLTENQNIDIVYSDEDKLTDDGRLRKLPFFKPDWSPDLLLGVNYITHFLVFRRTLIEKVGGVRSAFDGAQDYDLLLRLTEETDRIWHIPKILYHWRLADGSTSKNVGEKNYADDAGQRALKEAVKRRGLKADVLEIPGRPTNYRLKFRLPERQPKVSIIIPFKDKPELLKQCTDSILQKTTYENYELILVSNNSIEETTDNLLNMLKEDARCKVYRWNHPFNYSKINNFGARKSTGDYLVLLNNDTEVITPGWLEELVGVASQPGVGAVGPTLFYPDKKNGIQHAGVVVGMGGMAGHVFRHHQLNDWTDFGMPAWPRDYLAVTGACLVMSKKLYQQMNGLDEVFTVAGQDVAFGIKLHEAGYRNVYWPFASLYHYESVSVGTYNNGIQLDYDHSLTYYKYYHEHGDPYFNPNLDIMSESPTLRRGK